MNDKVSSTVYGSMVLAAAVALSAIGCLPQRHAVSAPRSAVAGIGDRSTCLDRHIKAIWTGKDIAGSECLAFHAEDGAASTDEQRRIRKVCEHTQIRTVLSGEAATAFTLKTCAAALGPIEPPALRRTCKAVARAQSQDLNPVQFAACSEYLRQGLSTQAARSAGLRVAQRSL
jgi:hypothetical protein